jgi:diguanylate cyclase (GGDEF)-like protein
LRAIRYRAFSHGWAFHSSLERNEVHISASIGISLFPADGQDAEALLKHADSAMYLAKERGRGNYQFFA